jgi:rubrerythrin
MGKEMCSDISEETKSQLLVFQKNEITEYHIYRKLAEIASSPENAEILRRIAEDEKQ